MPVEDAGELARLRDALNDARRQGERDRATIEALRAAAGEQRRETQHQVRNILSVVRSIARRTAAEGETAEEYRARLESRLASFTRLQALILRDPPGGVDLYTLVSDELLTFRLGIGAQACVEGPDVRLQPKPASVLGLAFHELACVTIDGDLGEAGAHLDVNWRVEVNGGGSSYLRIQWTQTGRGADAGPGPNSAFDREFLEQAVNYELGGDVRLDVTHDGLTCRFRLPIESVVLQDGDGDQIPREAP